MYMAGERQSRDRRPHPVKEGAISLSANISHLRAIDTDAREKRRLEQAVALAEQTMQDEDRAVTQSFEYFIGGSAFIGFN